MLDNELKAQLAAYLERLQAPLTLIATLDDTDASRDMRAMLGDIVEAGAGRITLKDAGEVGVEPGSRLPSFRITQHFFQPVLVQGNLFFEFIHDFRIVIDVHNQIVSSFRQHDFFIAACSQVAWLG